jgi:hypothetical protein
MQHDARRRGAGILTDALAEICSAAVAQYSAESRGFHHVGGGLPTVRPTILHPGPGIPSIIVG